MHRLVQEAVRNQLDDAQKLNTYHEVHRILAGARPRVGDTDDPANWPRYAIIWPHLTPSFAVDCEDEPVRQLLIDRVRFLWKTRERHPGPRLRPDAGEALGGSGSTSWGSRP